MKMHKNKNYVATDCAQRRCGHCVGGILRPGFLKKKIIAGCRDKVDQLVK
jgi:hypothetical protein